MPLKQSATYSEFLNFSFAQFMTTETANGYKYLIYEHCHFIIFKFNRACSCIKNVIHTLRNFDHDGIIRVSGKKVEILNAERLRQVSRKG